MGALYGTKQKESVLPEGTDPKHDPGECLLNQNQEDCGKKTGSNSGRPPTIHDF